MMYSHRLGMTWKSISRGVVRYPLDDFPKKDMERAGGLCHGRPPIFLSERRVHTCLLTINAGTNRHKSKRSHV